ncbi:MAG TPA: PP2C family protein-serine/threonine phosphatase [Chitinophagales bacterium]|nr:PP2C family protein-serine/threonine phosphatase [Chitinophagales bacterium]
MSSLTEQATLEKLVASYERLVRLKQLQIDALLDISQAINNNFPTSALLRIYEFTLKAQFSVPKLLVFVKNENWECVCASGVSSEAKGIDIERDLIFYEKMTHLDEKKISALKDFDVVIPVIHQGRALAFVLIGDMPENISTEEQLRFIQTLTNIAIVAVENRRLLRVQIEQEVLKKELELAAQMQSTLFPEKLPDNDRVEMAAVYLPHHDIGGDYYDYIELPDGRMMFCVGDISGKGVAAALLMSNFQANLRLLAKDITELTVFIEMLNDIVNRITRGEKFITLFLGIYNPKTRMLQYVNAGHNPSILYEDGNLTELTKGCTLLGMFEDLPRISAGELTVKRNALLINYTDGLTDFENEKQEYYGIERLNQFIRKHHWLDAEKFNKKLIEEVTEFKGAGGIFLDDITLLTCRFF